MKKSRTTSTMRSDVLVAPNCAAVGWPAPLSLRIVSGVDSHWYRGHARLFPKGALDLTAAAPCGACVCISKFKKPRMCSVHACRLAEISGELFRFAQGASLSHTNASFRKTLFRTFVEGRQKRECSIVCRISHSRPRPAPQCRPTSATTCRRRGCSPAT